MLIVKSHINTATDVLIADVGVEIPAGGVGVTFEEHDIVHALQKSNYLRSLANDNAYGAGQHTLILNDGSQDILAADIEAFLDQVTLSSGTQAVVLADGSVSFNQPVAGIYPVNNSDLATKQYVDDTATSGGITAIQHEALDTLVHRIAETSYTEVIRSSGQVTSVIVWTNNTKVKKIRETTVTRSSGQVATIVEKQYDSDGNLIIDQTLTHTISRSSGQIISIDTVEV